MNRYIGLFLALFFTGICCGQTRENSGESPGFDLQTKAANDQCLSEYIKLGGNAFYCNEDGTRNPNGKSVFVWYTHNDGKRVSTSPLFELKNVEKLLLYPDRVGALRIAGSIVFDDDLRGISKMEGLKQLLVSGEFSNDALDHLSPSTGLEKLWIADTRITGAGIAKLKSLTSLKLLHIDSSGLTPDSLRGLVELPNLRSLEIYNAEDIENRVGELLPNVSVNQLPARNQNADSNNGG